MEVSTDSVQPEEALSWFRNRTPVDPDIWHELDQDAQRRAFTVAHASSLDVLDEIWRAIDRAIADGTGFDEFRRSTLSSLNSDAHAETVFRTNTQAAYSSGRYRQATDPEVLEARPQWMFDAILDSRTTEYCRPIDGTIRPASDPFWFSHVPPLHFNCRSQIITLTPTQARVRGGDTGPIPEHDSPTSGFGAPPRLSEWQPKAEDFPPELWAAFQRWQEQRR